MRSALVNDHDDDDNWGQLQWKTICRCKGLCNLDHNGCSRGVLPYSMLHCPTSFTALTGSHLNFVTFEKRNVETYNKGKPYSTIEKVETPMDYLQFMQKLRLFCINSFIVKDSWTQITREEFSSYAEHIVTAWFLRSTKLELLDKQSGLQQFLTLVSDFGENILVTRKHETADQYFHRMQICLFGTVCTLPSSLDETKKETVSHMITSNYK